MKKVVFLFATISGMLLASCSGDDSGGGSGSNVVKFKVNGTQKTFTSVTATAEDMGDGDIYVSVAALSSPGNPTEAIYFDTFQGDIGPDAITDFGYQLNETIYLSSNTGANLTGSVSTNTNKRLKGTFSRTLSDGAGHMVTVTEGSFDVAR